MKNKHKHLCKDEVSSLDIISTLPQSILETILCLLPTTKEAVRTSILSREWRYKWTEISKLKFRVSEVRVHMEVEDEIMEQMQDENMPMWLIPFYDLLRILLLHHGTIHEFTLELDQHDVHHDTFGIDQVMLYLAKNHTVKKFTFSAYHFLCFYKLPISVFSLPHLTDLDLSSVIFEDQPIVNGSGTLRSLVLHEVGISTKTLLRLLSNCPSLKSLSLCTILHDKDCTTIELFKCLPVIEHLTIVELFKFIPEIEHLTTWHHAFLWPVLDSVSQEVPTTLFHLKYFCFKEMCFVDGYGLAFLLVLIKCSPNLEKIKLEIDADHGDHGCYEEYAVVWEHYSDVRLEHLNELEIDGFSNLENEMKIVKFILGRSPNLKKVSIHNVLFGDEQLDMSEVLLRAPRASPVAISFKDL